MAIGPTQQMWRDSFEKKRDGLEDLLTWDRFENWELSCNPELMAETELKDALEILYSSVGKKIANELLEVAIERMFAKSKFQSRRCKDSYPENTAVATRTLVYARALLTSDWSVEDLVTASKGAEKHALSGRWDDHARYYYLHAVSISLIAGGRARAQDLMSTKKKFNKYFKYESDLLKSKPDVFMKTGVARLELAAIRSYSVSKSGDIEWKQVIRQVSRD